MSKLTDFRVAVLATDGFEESELTEPVNALREASAQVSILSLQRDAPAKENWLPFGALQAYLEVSFVAGLGMVEHFRRHSRCSARRSPRHPRPSQCPKKLMKRPLLTVIRLAPGRARSSPPEPLDDVVEDRHQEDAK